MAAVLLLVFLPLLAAIGFMFGAGGVLGALTFLLLGGGMFIGMMKMSRQWEAES